MPVQRSPKRAGTGANEAGATMKATLTAMQRVTIKSTAQTTLMNTKGGELSDVTHVGGSNVIDDGTSRCSQWCTGDGRCA